MKFAKIFIPVFFLYIGMTLLTFQYYRNTSRALDNELHKRMQNTAQAVKLVLESSPYSEHLFEAEDPDISDLLTSIEESFSLENAMVLDMFHEIVNSTNPFVDLDGKNQVELTPGEKASLIEKEIIIRPLFNLGGSQFKTVILPLTNGLDTGVFMMDVNLSYLETISTIKRRYLYGVIISTLLFIAVLVFGICMVKLLEKSQAEKEKNQKLALMGKMTASIAHEIKNPLGIIKSSAQLIEKKYSQAKDEAFNYIYEELDRLDRNINNYLSFSRDITIQPQSVNLDEHVKQVVKDFPEVIFKPGNVQEIFYDPYRLTQLLRNLIINAQTHGGGRVTVSTKSQNSERSLQVCDEGPGISRDMADKIFEPFTTSSQAGTGLGLSICKRIAELHGGRITVQNQPAGGACFTVTIGNPS